MCSTRLRSILLAAPVLVAISASAAPGLEGRLEAGDPQLPEKQYYDTYTFEGVEGEALRFEVISPDFLPGGMLFDPSGTRIHQSLGNAFDKRWGIECRLTATGTWEIAVFESFWHEGNYTLSLYDGAQSTDTPRCDE
jgi:hypothetical protein